MPARHFLCLLSLSLLFFALPVRADLRSDAVTAYREGRYADVITRLEGQTDPALMLLRARAAAELGKADLALAYLGDARGFPADVQADLAGQRRTWAARAGRCDQLGPSVPKDPGHVEARCAVASRDFQKAEAMLKDAKDDDGRALLFAALVGLGQTDRAKILGRLLYVEAPAHADAPRFAELLKERDGSIRLITVERLDRAQKLIAARRVEDALRELDAMGEPPEKEQRARYHHLRGDALFKLRNRYAEATKAFDQAHKLGGATEAYDAFHAVRALSRAGQDRKAIPRYRAFAKKYPKSNLAPDALYLAAWLSARENLPSARKELAEFATSEVAKSVPNLRRDALWDLAWHALGKKEGKEAERWLEKYAKEANSNLERARAAYWRGQAAMMRKEKSLARTHWVSAMDAERLGYYAQLAAMRLRALGETPPSPFVKDGRELPRPADVVVPEGVRFYAELGLVDDAARLAEPWVAGFQDRGQKVVAWLAAGQTAKAHIAADPLAQEVLATPPQGPASWLWEALLPRPYPEAMATFTAQYGLDVDEVYGHMQVESRYQPRAVSGADALGLLQLLPGTAFGLAKGAGKTVTRQDILVPSINIELASRFLGALIKEHKGQLPLAIAAYNAGSPRVKGWSTKPKPLDQWVEDIPVEQTRNYVRRVIGAWSRYHAVSHPDDPWGLPLPAEVGSRPD